MSEIASAITNSSDWLAAVRQARQHLHRQHPDGVDCAAIGYHAWRQLTPIQQAQALPDLFTAYVVQLNEDERHAKLAATAAVKTYLDGEEEYLLHGLLNSVRPIGDDDTTVDAVPAWALANVLDELDLLRHRLAMAKPDQEGGRP